MSNTLVKLPPKVQERLFVLEELKIESHPAVRGLQLPKQVLFEDWDVGGKYSKSIFIYNPSAKIQRFLYEVPKSSAFVMALPKPIKLHSKTGVKLNIHFHPKEKRDYNDKLFIKTADNEKMLIKLEALTHFAFITGPEKLAFEMCGVSHSVQKTFTIKNNSRSELEIIWNVLPPFSVEPSSTIIEVDQKCTIKAIFSPNKAAVYTSKAVCTPKNSKTSKKAFYTIIFTAQGVYPYLSVINFKSTDCPHEYEFNFGVVNVNSSITKEIVLFNPLPIKTNFTLTRSKYHLTANTPYSFEVLSGEIAPLGKYTLKAMFAPVMPNITLSDVWYVNVSGGFSTKIIAMAGTSSGPLVTLSTSIVNFCEVERGSLTQKTITISNTSSVNTVFQFEIDCAQSAFHFEPSIGVLAKQSKVVIQVHFAPIYPITYYRRIPCVVHMHKPIYLDLIGSAISSEIQPERLQSWHLETFWLQIRKGQFFFKDENCVLPVITPKPQPPSVDEYLCDGYHTNYTIIPPPLSLDQNLIDFGRCGYNYYIPTKVFSVTNHTYFVLTITWMGGPHHVFSIKPLIVDIQPHRTAVFHLTFKPLAASQIYSSELEGYAHCTGTGTAALNPGDFNWPPWCLTLSAMGHTYVSEKAIYRANYELSSYKIQLPSVPVRSHATRTILLNNKTPTTKIVFNITSNNDELVIKPRSGVVLRPFIILTIGLTPRLPGSYSSCIYFETNFDKFSIQEIEVEGIASQPLLSFDYVYGLYFKPCCIRVKAERIVVVHNMSPIVVSYRWTIKPVYRDILTVKPHEGSISPNGMKRFRFYFCPRKRIRYTFSVSLTATSEGSFGIIVQKQQELTIVGEGIAHCLKVEPENLNIGALIVGTLKKEKFTLKNLSYCGLNVELSIEESAQPFYNADDKVKKQCLFLGDKENDLCVHIPARCNITIDFKVLPQHHGSYHYKIYYRKLSSFDADKFYLCNSRYLCCITMQGAHPILQVVEARFLGSATDVRRDRAWELLSLEKLNEYLASEPNFETKSMQLDESLFPLINSMQSITKTAKKINFHIPPASVGSTACTLILLLRNPGSVECQWNVWYPWEQKVDVEIWAHTGLFLKNEIEEGRMKDDKLIQIQPKKGHLLPGETQFMSLVYVHQYSSNNILSVRFCLHSGVDIKINIIAETFDRDIPQVYFPFTVHKFSPISYGFSEAIVVSYNIPNHSDSAIKLRLDVLPLKRFQKLHYSHPVIDCLTRRLIIQPGEYLSILWQVWPLEERIYQVDIPIKFDSDSHFRTLTLQAPASVKPESLPKTDKPLMILPTQFAFLSHDRISFGHVPVCCKLHKIVFITNNSVYPIRFDWYMPYKLLRQRIIFEPKTGRISPNSSCLCQVTLMTGHTPAIYDIYCHAKVMTVKNSQIVSRPKQHARASVQVNISASNVFKNKVATVDGALFNDTNGQFHVHLELKAQTHMLEDFWRFFPKQIHCFFIQRPRVRPQKDERFSTKKVTGQMEMEQETIEIVEETITILLYNALNDIDFANIVYSACQDPIPYYFQIRSSKEYVKTRVSTSDLSLSSTDSFEKTYWTHTNILSRQKTSIRKTPTPVTDIFNETYVPAEMKTFPEAMIGVETIFESMICTILEEAYKIDFNIFARPRFPSNIIP